VAYPLALTVSDHLQIFGFDLDHTQIQPGQAVWLTLYWRARQDVERDYVVNLRLLNPAGDEASYRLGRPIQSGIPTNEWRQGQVVQDPWRIEVPVEAAPGLYRLVLVLFDVESEQAVIEASLADLTVLASD
ncbi:MAG: hypothetical protein R3264_19380, partial [Anaerolineae bacterium]|nr:hypothetical protein [Anaerolineae bacterium]